MFSSLQLTDDDAFLGGPSHESLGLIEIKIEPVQVTKRFPTCTSARSLSDIKIHERSKKAVTQQITLAEPEVVLDPQGSVGCRSIGPELVKFSFKYRPADVLRANGIMPPPPQLKRKAPAEPLDTQVQEGGRRRRRCQRGKNTAREIERNRSEAPAEEQDSAHQE
ncbi:hypothetical protein MSAN_00065800 [Mycena sanguinolenta]|uniref:DUF7918 domain-containing protein n=1 Tax=Mycena sanguinolenta TaxID=230812 RepID=A0A8H6ZFE7_9AGAR|nr:hypothetical protein MSAN_00065800 [Mycena sanguinolenta]